MPRSGPGVYLKPAGTTPTNGDTIDAPEFNLLMDDIAADLNLPRPVAVGGTGASNAADAMTNLGGLAKGNSLSELTDKPASVTNLGFTKSAAVISRNIVQPGAIEWYAMATPPAGRLKANGAAVSRTTYADLFAAIGTAYGAGNGSTTFNVPDLRASFARGWDDGRGVDPSRVFGSNQDSAIINHTHTGTTSGSGAHSHTFDGTSGSNFNSGQSVNFTMDATGGATANGSKNTGNISAVGDHTHTLTTGNPSVGGAAETRPRNIALLACIVY